MWGLVASIYVFQRTRFRSQPRTLNFYDDCLVVAVPRSKSDAFERARRLSPHDLRDTDPQNELIALWDIERVTWTPGKKYSEIGFEIRGSHPLAFYTPNDAANHDDVHDTLLKVFGDRLTSGADYRTGSPL